MGAFQFLEAAPKKKQREIPRAVPVEDFTRFDNSVLPAVTQAPMNPENIPNFNQAQDNFALSTNNAEYFRVPEKVREERDIARNESLKKSQLTLYRYLKKQRTEIFGETDHPYWEKIIQQEAAFLEEVFFQSSVSKQQELLDSKFKESPQLKSALSYMGLLRLHGIHGKLGTITEQVVLSALPLDAPEGMVPTKSIHVSFEAASQEVLEAQKIEKSFHAFRNSSPFTSYSSKFALEKNSFNFSSIETESVPPEIRLMGLDLLWDLRHELLSNAKAIDQRFGQMLALYAPYSRIYIDVFKQDAMGPGSPEFLAIWRADNPKTKFRKELLGLGLITTGRRTDSRWALAGDKGASGNTPDGIFRVVGFHKKYVSQAGDDMRGLVMLSYGNSRAFSGRGFHHVFFYSPWGTNASHGCIRVYTGSNQMGLANLIWASINPMQLDQVDYMDMGNINDNNRFKETQSVREVVRYMRDNVWVSNFSEHSDGYLFAGEATYSQQIRRQYENFTAITGVSVLSAAQKLKKEDQKIIGPMGTDSKGRAVQLTHTGKYWVYDQAIREKLFGINLRK